MALELLFPHFDELIRMPEDVQRLNEAILQLAVQGKLVAQDPNDEPASKLLKQIEAKTQSQLSEREFETRSGRTAGSQGAPPEMPVGWEWIKMGEIVESMTNGIYKPANFYDDQGIACLRMYNIQAGMISFHDIKRMELTPDEVRTYGLRAGDLIVNRVNSRELVGKAAVIPALTEPLVYESKNIRVRFRDRCVDPEYVSILFRTPIARSIFDEIAKQTTGQASINQAQLSDLQIPLPPLAEQHRIVAKVDELFAQTRALEARLRRAQADVVTANRAALHRLHSAQDDDQFQTAWRTIRDHFDVLYDDPRTVAELRQAILDLAVRGKLVAQDPNDEPAKELLKRIAAEKRLLVHEKKLGKSKPMAPIKARETSFELPNGWHWSRLGDLILEIQTGPFGSTLHKSDYVEGGVPVINPANIRDGQIEPLANMAVSEETKTRLSRYVLEKGDIVMGRRGEMGRCAIVSEREAGWLCGSGSFNLKTSSDISQEYLVSLIRSPEARGHLSGGSVGSTMNNLNHRILSQMVVGVPPLAEQHRIVAKVDQLMRLCDELEAGLARTESQRRKLAAAVLNTL